MHHTHYPAPRVSLSLRTLALFALLAAPAAQAGPTIAFGDQGSLQINYALQAWLQHSSYTSAEHDGDNYDFFLRRNRLTFSGQVSDLIGFYVTLEAANDGKAGRDDRSVYFRDAYITADYSDAIRFIVGRFKNTFSRENLEACLESLTLDRQDLGYTPFGGTRDSGAAVWGNLANAAFQYRFMVADGREGEFVPKSTPRLTARVHWSPLDPEYEFGYRGTYLGTRRVLTLGVAYDTQNGVAYSDFPNRTGLENYRAWTVDGFFEYPLPIGTVTASAAWFDYSVGDAINQSPDPDLPFNTESKGFYVKAGYLLPRSIGPGRVQAFARYDETDYQLTGGELDRRLYTAGVNYLVNGGRFKFTLEHQRVNYARPDALNPTLQDNHETTLALQFVY